MARNKRDEVRIDDNFDIVDVPKNTLFVRAQSKEYVSSLIQTSSK